MTVTESHAQSDALRLVQTHLQKLLSLSADDIKVKRLNPPDLPAGTQEFYAELHGGRHDNVNCLVLAERVYCSRAPDEFARFLKDYRYFEKRDLTPHQVMRLYGLFALPRQLKSIDAALLARNAAQYRAYPEVAAPTLAHSDAGMLLTFWATPPLELKPTRWLVNLSPSYVLQVHQNPAAAVR